MKESEIILLNINGEDKQGLTAALTEILARHRAFILDIGQSDIHRNLSLGILFKSMHNNSGEIMKDLLFKAYEMDVMIRFTPISPERYSNWVEMQGKDRYIITLLGRILTAEQIAAVSTIIAEQNLNIDNVTRLTGRIPLDEKQRAAKSCVELSVRGTPNDKRQMHYSFMELSSLLNFDISFQEESMYRRMRRMICFDMDSTLIQTEVIDELAEKAGVGAKVKQITEQAMNGEIDFEESFKKRVRLLKGLDMGVLKEVADNLPITEGLDRLMRVLKKVGFKTAILSGGFTYFGNYLQEKYGFDYIYANELEIVDGKLTGNYQGDIITGQKKAELLKLIAQVEKIDIRQTVAVGDGANDLQMLDTAGLGIAFHAKPKVIKNVDQSLSSVGIDGILYFLGYKDSMLDSELFSI